MRAGVSLDDVPMRRADNARILEVERHGFQHRGEWRAGQVAVRRNGGGEAAGGGVELQTRLYVGKLPVAYRSVPQPCCRGAVAAAARRAR